MKDKWLEELREGLSDFEMDAPNGLWESLGVERSVPKASWGKRWVAAAAAIAILIMGSGILLWLCRHESLEINNIKHTKAHENGQPGQFERNLAENQITAPTSNESRHMTIAQKVGNIQNHSEESTETIDPYVPDKESLSALTDTVNIEDIEPQVRADTSDDEAKQGKKHQPERQGSFYADISTKNKNRKRDTNDYDRLAINLSASGIGNASEGRNYLMPGLPGDDLFLGSSLPIITKIRHHMPFRIGLTLQYNVTKRIAFESGLVYSAIGSDISLSLNGLTATGTRRLQYVGVPLNVKFSAWSWKFVSLYLSAGATGEKCVSNRFETKSTAHNLSLETYSRQKDKPFQWSANAAAGIQLNPVPNIGIFVEPGLSYYFNDGTDLSTIYKDHPYNFNLNVGLRFNINP
ncbi:MAG: PorT family protein [Muribaculaceae bacterium]|nr:PorT family protein [Muribaculaceae bacterium]